MCPFEPDSRKVRTLRTTENTRRVKPKPHNGVRVPLHQPATTTTTLRLLYSQDDTHHQQQQHHTSIMTRKSKQSGGNYPLTHYERTKAFKSSEYGTSTMRLAGHSQYQLGDCALSLTRLGNAAVCSPSGHLYADDAIVEYLLTKTLELKEQQAAYDSQQKKLSSVVDDTQEKKRLADFQEAQKVVKKRKVVDKQQVALDDLKRTSYWLADAQPAAVAAPKLSPPPSRPVSPISQQPLRRKDVWPVALTWQDEKLVCAVSGKTFQTQAAATVYWTDRKKPGTLVLTDVYKTLLEEEGLCPNSSRKIKYTRELQKSGSSFASASGKSIVKKYRPTIT